MHYRLRSRASSVTAKQVDTIFAQNATVLDEWRKNAGNVMELEPVDTFGVLNVVIGVWEKADL